MNLPQTIRRAVMSSGASAQTRHGHLPPSSSVTGVRCRAAAAITARPTLVLPVKKMLSNLSRSSASAASRSPCTTAMYSSGKVALMSWAIAAAVCGANSDGLSTTQLPAASAPTNGESRSWSG